MSEVREITTMCKNGQIQEAYNLAKKDYAAHPTDIWQQRSVGWALYYMIKGDADRGDFIQLIEHLDELKSLDQLTMEKESMIFDNMQFLIASFIKNHIFLNDLASSAKLSTLFAKLKDYQFQPSISHSFLLQTVIKFENWPEMTNFFDWWNLDNLTQADYTPFVNSKGQKIMALAERAFIANSKALLKLNDAGRIEEFLPKLNTLMTQHEEMVYPGYFYGKLLLALGSDADEALKVIIPFARKKSTEFWVWQLLSDVFTNDENKQLACLLRAVHCRTQEVFLGKVRIKLATLYIKRKELDRARHHIDAVTRCYASQGWRLPYEIDNWIHQQWLNTVTPNSSDEIDFMSITDRILCDGAEECIAVVTYINSQNHRASMVYDHEKMMTQKLRFKVAIGDILKLHYIKDKEGRIKILKGEKIQLPNDLSYAKYVKGSIEKRDDKDFAFLRSDLISSYIHPTLVQKNKLKQGDSVKCLIVYDYNQKKESWNWICVTVKP